MLTKLTLTRLLYQVSRALRGFNPEWWHLRELDSEWLETARANNGKHLAFPAPLWPSITFGSSYSVTSDQGVLVPGFTSPYIEQKSHPSFKDSTFFLTANSLPLGYKMRSVTRLILSPLVALVLYKFLTLIITKYKHAGLANRLGCKPAPELPSRDPLGINNVIRMKKCNNAGRLLHHIMERNEISSKQEGRTVFTFRTHIFRNWLIFTCDPKNIQALLATQFDDFHLGSIRFGTFSPL
jgi:hypothetical protein